ncbi:MAG: hypothetical protein JW913_19660 [Chitinispirillaceae bacterium]|nr:hypothetical protein [Chitinispirillaceae bacterium]
MRENKEKSGGMGELKVIEGGKVKKMLTKGISPLFAKKPIQNINDARKMLSKLIHGFQMGTIESTDAKTLCYLLISYCQLVRDTDFEDRIKALETKVGKR